MITTEQLKERLKNPRTGTEFELIEEVLRYRQAAGTPSCWEIAGQLFTTKEEALKPGYVGTPEPLYDGPVLEADREAQPVAGTQFKPVADLFALGWENGEVCSFITDPEKAVLWLTGYTGTCVQEYVKLERLQDAHTAPPAPAVPHEKTITPFFDTIALDTARSVMCDVNRRSDFLGGDIQLLARIQCRIDEACRAAMLAQPVSQGYKLPDGWRLVPIEATPEILQAGITAHYERQQYQQPEDAKFVGPMESAYNAMLAAAPEGGNG